MTEHAGLIWEIELATDIGKVKPSNEDNFYYAQGVNRNSQTYALCAVADGMGGLDFGDVASSLAVSFLKQWWEERVFELVELPSDEGITQELEKDMPDSIILRQVDKELEQVFQQTNDTLIYEGKQKRKRIGTTLSLIFLFDNTFLVKHIGDSRIYAWNGNVHQLTEDHSWVAEQVRLGKLKPGAAEAHPSRNILTQCLGVTEGINVYTTYGVLEPYYQFLICSDGFYTMVPQKVWHSMLNSNEVMNQPLKAVTQKLVTLANEAGGKDNITVGIIRKCGKKRSTLKQIIKRFFNE